MRTYVESGGNFLAQCASVVTYENEPGVGSLLTTAGLKGLTLVDDYRLLQGSRDIEERYRKAGYAFVSVTATVEMVDGEPAAVITVREGPHVRVKAIEVVNFISTQVVSRTI